MISYSIDDSGRVLALSYSRHVKAREYAIFLKAFRKSMDQLRPGFVLFSDLTNLESMDPDCAEPLGVLMELISERGMATVVRILPDPAKDIGFNLISLFHYRKPVRVYTVPNLAEAVKLVLEEAEKAQPT